LKLNGSSGQDKLYYGGRLCEAGTKVNHFKLDKNLLKSASISVVVFRQTPRNSSGARIQVPVIRSRLCFYDSFFKI